VVLARLDAVDAVFDEQIDPAVPVGVVDGARVVGIQLLDAQVFLEAQRAQDCITLRQ
jgi:hypothetical protein